MLAFHALKDVTVAGFAADANPNVTQPAVTKVFVPTGRVGGQGADSVSRNIGVYHRGADAAGVEQPTGTVTFTVWMRDSGASKIQAGTGAVRDQWINMGTFTTIASSVISKVAALGDTFVQVTAISAGGSSKFQQFIGELTT
jgi:hypothetical protein